MQTQKYETKQPVQSQRLSSRKGWVHRLFADVFFVARREGKWWLLPLIFLLLILGGLLAFAVSLGPLAPFVYPLL